MIRGKSVQQIIHNCNKKWCPDNVEEQERPNESVEAIDLQDFGTLFFDKHD